MAAENTQSSNRMRGNLRLLGFVQQMSTHINSHYEDEEMQATDNSRKIRGYPQNGSSASWNHMPSVIQYFSVLTLHTQSQTA